MFIPSTNADSVFGCGGFVKSDVDINFSLVEVRSPVTSCSCRNVVVHSTTTTTTTYKNTNASCRSTSDLTKPPQPNTESAFVDGINIRQSVKHNDKNC
jgi:hypothetical protein